MPEWTGEIVGAMHVNKITAKQLADEIGWDAKYLSAILNGHRTPVNAEKQVRAALARLLDGKNNEC